MWAFFGGRFVLTVLLRDVLPEYPYNTLIDARSKRKVHIFVNFFATARNWNHDGANRVQTLRAGQCVGPRITLPFARLQTFLANARTSAHHNIHQAFTPHVRRQSDALRWLRAFPQEAPEQASRYPSRQSLAPRGTSR